jgi:hypothetical protein
MLGLRRAPSSGPVSYKSRRLWPARDAARAVKRPARRGAHVVLLVGTLSFRDQAASPNRRSCASQRAQAPRQRQEPRFRGSAGIMGSGSALSAHSNDQIRYPNFFTAEVLARVASRSGRLPWSSSRRVRMLTRDAGRTTRGSACAGLLGSRTLVRTPFGEPRGAATSRRHDDNRPLVREGRT